MSWVCPYMIGDECSRLRKKCQPSQRGCVLEDNVKLINYEGGVVNKKRQNNDISSSNRSQRRQQKDKR